MTVGLVAHSWKGDAKVMEPDEMTEWKWFDLKHLPENMYFPSAKVIENYKRQAFYLEQ